MDWEDVKIDDLVEGKEYRISWVSSMYTERFQFNKGDCVLLLKKHPNCDIEVKKSSDTYFDNFFPSHILSYSYITLEKEKQDISVKRCTCDIKEVMWYGCLCGAFKAGDK